VEGGHRSELFVPAEPSDGAAGDSSQGQVVIFSSKRQASATCGNSSLLSARREKTARKLRNPEEHDAGRLRRQFPSGSRFNSGVRSGRNKEHDDGAGRRLRAGT